MAYPTENEHRNSVGQCCIVGFCKGHLHLMLTQVAFRCLMLIHPYCKLHCRSAQETAEQIHPPFPVVCF